MIGGKDDRLNDYLSNRRNDSLRSQRNRACRRDTNLSEKDLASAAVERVRAMIRGLGLPQRISDLGIPQKDLPKIAKWTTEFVPSLLRINPRTSTEKDLLEILRKAY